MKTYTTGQQAQYGMYLSGRPLDMCFVGADGDVLDGKPGARYARIPTLLLIALSPAIGGAFVVLFPVLILVALAGTVAQLVARSVRSAVRRHAYLAEARWEPATAYLNASKEDEKAEGESEDEDVEPELEALAEEVKTRREAEEQGGDE